MMKTRENLEKLISIFENEQNFQKIMTQRLQSIKKNYIISNMSSFSHLIRLMSMCLMTDYFISILKPECKQIKLLNQLRKEKENLLHRIRENQSILTIQGKMKQYSKNQGLHIVVIKLTHHILSLNSAKICVAEEQLFRRLNFLLCGVNVSNKSYKLSLNRVNHSRGLTKQKQSCELRVSSNLKQNSQFKKIFFSLNDLHSEKKILSESKKNQARLNDQSRKIANLIQKSKNTIQSQTKKLSLFEKNNKRPRQNKIRQLSQLQDKQLEKMPDIGEMRKKSSSRCKKRVGTINEEPDKKCELKNLQNLLSNQNENSFDNESSYESIPYTNQNWYQCPNDNRVNRIYTLSFPGLVSMKQR